MKRPLPPARVCACLVLCLAPLSALRAESGVPPVLDAVLRKMALDQGHWACVWSSVYTHRRGHPEGEWRSIAEPSRPYADQWRPVLIDGHPPDEQTLRGFRERGERQGRDAEGPAAAGGDGAPYEVHMTLDYNLANQQAVALYDQAQVVKEDGDHVTFEVPLRSNRASVLLPQFWRHCHMLLRVNRGTNNLEHLTILMRRGVVLVRTHRFQIDADYATPDPRYSAVEVAMDAEIDATVAFKAFYFRQQVTCSDFRRVRPYGDRFKVRIGPLRSLGVQSGR